SLAPAELAHVLLQSDEIRLPELVVHTEQHRHTPHAVALLRSRRARKCHCKNERNRCIAPSHDRTASNRRKNGMRVASSRSGHARTVASLGFGSRSAEITNPASPIHANQSSSVAW